MRHDKRIKNVYDLIACMYVNEGVSLLKLAEMNGVSHKAVSKALIRRGIKMRPKGAYRSLNTKRQPILAFHSLDKDIKHKISKIVLRAVNNGTLEKPDFCPVCMKDENVLLEGHHEDYSKPLEVEWMCGSCHHTLHRLLRRYPYLSKLYS